MEKIKDLLIKKGVKMPCPESVEIGDDINPDRISGDNVIIHSGCKLYGSKTLVLSGVKLGYEAPATVCDCQIGKNVELSGGYFYGSAFLENSSIVIHLIFPSSRSSTDVNWSCASPTWGDIASPPVNKLMMQGSCKQQTGTL